MKKVLLCFSFILFSISLFAQIGFFRSFSLREGLSQSSIFCLLQDSKGYIWLGTDGGGICRFDGKSMITLTHSDGMHNNTVRAFAIDSLDRLWIGHINGMSLYNGTHFVELPSALKGAFKDGVRTIHFDKMGVMRVGTSNGVFKYEDGFLSEIVELTGFAVNVIKSDMEGNIWYASSGNGLFNEKPNSENGLVSVDLGMDIKSITSIAFDKKDNFILGTPIGAFKYSINEQNVELQNDFMPKISVSSVLADSSDIWVGTEQNGLFRFKNDTLYKVYSPINGLSVNIVNSLYKDRQGNILIGTHGDGLKIYSSSPFTTYYKEEGVLSNAVLSILEDSEGTYWFGSDHGICTLKPLDERTGQYEYVEKYTLNGKNLFRTWGIIQDRNGSMWVTTYGDGVFKIDGNKVVNFNEENGLASNMVRTIYEDDNGNIWIGTINGLNKYSDGILTTYKYQDGLVIGRILCIFQDKDGDMWFGTAYPRGTGVIKYDGIRFTNYGPNEGLVDDAVLCVTQDKDGYIWCATYGGLSRIDKNISSSPIVNLTTSDGLASSMLYVAAMAENGDLLVGSNNGLDKINVREFNRSGKLFIKHFGYQEGFTGIECNTNAVYSDKSDNLWFGTIKGVVKYDEKEEFENGFDPPINVITNVRLYLENVDWLQRGDSLNLSSGLPVSLQLRYNENHVTFDFLGIDFHFPEKIKHSFKLEGFDNNWSKPSKQTTATYSNLSPGAYVFKVKSINEDGEWSVKHSEFNFEIEQPFWQSWWFGILILVLFFLLVYVIIFYRLKSLNERSQKLAIKVKERTKELEDERDKVKSQNKLIEQSTNAIKSSINYAKRIQDSILPNKEDISLLFPESFILFKPRDIVSGDFYWVAEVEGFKIVSIADCTGHGVPGAFMSMVGNTLFNQILFEKKITEPSLVLNSLHKGIMDVLQQNKEGSQAQDGMDISFCCIDEKTNQISFSGAKHPIIIIQEEEMQVVKGDPISIGGNSNRLDETNEIKFSQNQISYKQGAMLYMYTDGFPDQFGGDDNIKFNTERFKNLLMDNHKLPLDDQLDTLSKALVNWVGKHKQLDDILVMGIKL